MYRAKIVLGICSVIIFLFSSQTQASQWRYSGSTERGKVYYDESSIKRVNKNIVQVWEKTIYKAESKKQLHKLLKEKNIAPNNPNMLSYDLTLMQYDCVNAKSRLSSTTIYDEKGHLEPIRK